MDNQKSTKYFIASDPQGMPKGKKISYQYLEDGDIATISLDKGIEIVNIMQELLEKQKNDKRE